MNGHRFTTLESSNGSRVVLGEDAIERLSVEAIHPLKSGLDEQQ